MSHGLLRHEIPTFKCHGCKKGCTKLGPREKQQMGATKTLVGMGAHVPWGG